MESDAVSFLGTSYQEAQDVCLSVTSDVNFDHSVKVVLPGSFFLFFPSFLPFFFKDFIFK